MLSKVSSSLRAGSARPLRASLNRASAPRPQLARSVSSGRLLPFLTPSAPAAVPDRLPGLFARQLSAPAAAASGGLRPLTSVLFSVSHAPGSLQKALSYFWKHDINMTRLESRPSTRGRDFTFHVSFEGDQSSDKVKRLLKDLADSHSCTGLQIIDPKKVPWFPTRIQDVELFANQILDAGTDLQADHHGFSDKTYRRRRQELANIAMSFRFGEKIPRIEYTEDEIATWSAVFNKLYPLYQEHACREHLECFNELMKHVGYAPNNIPQAQDISDFLRARTGFSLRPVAGLLSARNFLYGLAFRVFFSTQYIRHHSKPLYTPEPDICHELMGHVPLFGDPDFADFSQEIGLASIGATDEQILKLSRCYWFSVEFGLCKEKGKRKAYGAGLLSSFGELEYAMSDKPEVRPWDPFNAAEQDYPITTYQPVYYSAESFEDAKLKMKEFSQSLVRPFNVRYNENYQTIEVDTTLEMLPQKQAAPAYSKASA